MIRARRRAFFGMLVLLAAGVFAAQLISRRSAKPSAKPGLMLLTSLPIVFGEQFDLKSQGSPALAALSRRFAVRPISTSSKAELSKGRLLLMAQPPAQSPENLVALDEWVRGGGRVLLLADPMLEWPSHRSLADPLRPPIMFTDTGLLAHWRLRLDAPEQRGPAPRTLAGHRVAVLSPGSLAGECAITPDAFTAICKLGRGRAAIVADADLLNAGAGSPELAAVVDLLAWLSGDDSQRTDLSTGTSARTR